MRCANERKLNASGPIVAHKPTLFSAEKLLTSLQALHGANHYALAVSGGRDSMGLLTLAAQAAKLPDAPQFSVLTVDHGLRAEAQDEARMVAEACASLALPHHILQADRKLGGTDVQQQARNMRYRLMAAFCRPLKAPLVTAHHLHDQAETIAMRLARGSGVDGLAGMSQTQWLTTEAGRLLVLRPMLEAHPDDIHGANHLPYADDPSNTDTRFERVRWRQHMPQMTEAGLSPVALAGLARDMRRLREGRRTFLRDWLSAHGDWHDYGVLTLPRAAFLDLPQDIGESLLSACVRLLGRHQYPPRRAALSSLGAQIGQTQSGAGVLGGVLMRWRQTTIFLGREYAALAQNGADICADGYWDGRFHMKQKPDGHFVAPLGEAGVAALREKGVVFDTRVPAAYHTVLPALFDTESADCAVPVGLATENHLSCVSSTMLFDALLGQRQDW